MATSAIQTLRPDRASVYRALMKLVNLINQCRLAFTPTNGTLRQARICREPMVSDVSRMLSYFRAAKIP
jgi:hypothetical protein